MQSMSSSRWIAPSLRCKARGAARYRHPIAETLCEDRSLFCVTTAMTHYAKAVSHPALGDLPAAEQEATHFHAALAKVPPSRYLFNNTCLDIPAIAGKMMQGEIAYRQGNHDAAFSHLRGTVELDDNLPYDEPWGWMIARADVPIESSCFCRLGKAA
jgi:hypothetical protein